MQPSFCNYLREQVSSGIQEGFVILDNNLNEVTPDQFKLRRVKKGDIVHIVPAIFGGGGKRGGLLAILAVAAFAFVAVGALAGMAAAGAAAPIGAATSVTSLSMGGFLKNIVINIALSTLSTLLMGSGSSSTDDTTRNNNSFGSLVNTTTTNTPIALHYGLTRVAGQVINGHILSQSHSQDQTLSIYGSIVKVEQAVNTSSGDPEQKKLDDLLKGFNQYD